MRILGSVRRTFNEWAVTTAELYNESERAAYGLLVSTDINTVGRPNTDWLKVRTFKSFPAPTQVQCKFTEGNSIVSNPTHTGITHYFGARCYDSADTFLGYFGLAYVFAISGNQKNGVYIFKDLREAAGGFSSNEVSSPLDVPIFNSTDVFELNINPTTRAWSVAKAGGNTVDAGTALGLLPVGTSYVLYEGIINIGSEITGTAELQILSIT